MTTSNQQLDINSIMNLMITMMIVVMMMKMMSGAMKSVGEEPATFLGSGKAPPSYTYIRTSGKASEAYRQVTHTEKEKERLRVKKANFENVGRKIAKETGVKFVELDEGWQLAYSTPKYWFRDSKGNDIVAFDADELRWKLSIAGR